MTTFSITGTASGTVPAGPAGPTGPAGPAGPAGSASGGVYTNVKNAPFNAKGDGSTDDTSAIVAALASLSMLGGVLYFPPGVFQYTAPIVVPSGVTLVGAGARVSWLNGGAGQGSAGIDFAGAGTEHRCSWGGARDIGFNGAGGTGPIVRLRYADHMKFDRCYFYNAQAPGLWVEGSFEVYLQGCDFSFVGATNWAKGPACIYLKSLVDDSTNHVYIMQTRCEDFPTGALFINANGGPNSYAVFVTQFKAESNRWRGAQIGVAFIDAYGAVDHLHVADAFLGGIRLDIDNGGLPGPLVHFSGSTAWQFDRIFASTNPGVADTVFDIDTAGSAGHDIQNVTLTGPVNVALMRYIAGAPTMTVRNIGWASGQSGVVYSGTFSPSITRV